MPWSKIGPYPGAYYKQHFACFACRKMVRKRSELELTETEQQTVRLGQMKCPECSGTLYNMGRAFRPPRQCAVRKWREIEAQYQRGMRWTSGRW